MLKGVWPNDYGLINHLNIRFMDPKTLPNKFSRWWPWLVFVMLVGIGIILWQPLSLLWHPEAEHKLQEQMMELGLLGPMAFLALSVIQIVGAPIPGHPVQILGGILFGTFWGGLYNVIGVLVGGFTAAWLARCLGRPFIEKQLSPEVLTKYETIIRSDTLWVWFILLTIPTGEIPYFLAGLSQVKFSTLLWATFLARGPFSFVLAWIGHHARTMPPSWIFWTISVLILGLIILVYLLKDHLSLWLDKYLQSLKVID